MGYAVINFDVYILVSERARCLIVNIPVIFSVFHTNCKYFDNTIICLDRQVKAMIDENYRR